jgi:hypothetical protein
VTTRARRGVPIVIVVVLAVVIAVVAGGPRHEGAALDPASDAPDGTKALVLLLQHESANVSVTPDVPDAAGAPVRDRVALVLSDNLSDDQHRQLAEWVRAGGTLVVTDDRSVLAGVAGLDSTEEGKLTPQCAVPAVAGVGRLVVPGVSLFRVPAGAVGCFPGDSQHGRPAAAFMVVRSDGQGNVVALGGPDAFVNERLAKGDNSVLAVSLLAPRAGTSVTILQPPGPGEGRKTLGDLISPRLKVAFVELILAFVVFCLWRARRLGRPILERQPVQLPGSELVIAVGNLFHRARRRDDAARLIRDELRRTLAERLSLERDAPVEVVADVVASRAGGDRAHVERVLRDEPVASDAELVELAQSAELVHQEVSRAR